MNRLSSALLAKIKANPLNTKLQTESPTDPDKGESPVIKIPIYPNLPENFDGPKIWTGFLSVIRNQGKCGSCWAWASVSALADRFSLWTNRIIRPSLSPLRPLLCDLEGKELEIKYPEFVSYNKELTDFLSTSIGKVGCHGSTLENVWRYLYIIGTNDDNCLSYFKNNNLIDYKDDSDLPLCTQATGSEGDMCGDFYREPQTGSESGTPARFFRAVCYYSLENSEKQIMSEIFMRGPVTAGMQIFDDFYDFNFSTGKVYKSSQKIRISGHAVRICGWGVQDGEKFWWVANSWGSDWGLNGYFKILRGVNHCQIESNVVTGIPDLFFPVYDPQNPTMQIVFPLFIHNCMQKIPERYQKQRHDMDFGNNMTAGGIDPRTGYTRKAQFRYTGYNNFKPILGLGKILSLLNTDQAFGEKTVKENFTNNNNCKNFSAAEIFILLFCVTSLLSFLYICWQSVIVDK